MSIELRTLLRGIGGTACAASTMVALATFAGGFASYTTVAAAGNKGDVWVDTVGSNDGPEMDPHLPCANFNVWGMKLQDGSGPFTIQGWPPSGAGASEVDYSATWHFDTVAGGQQIIATVPEATLLANARASGDTVQQNQGFHFKLPHPGGPTGDDKYKVFWIDCAGPTPTGSPQGTPTGSPQGTPTGSPQGTPTGSPESTPTGSPQGTPTGSPGSSPTPTTSPNGGVLGISTTSSATGGVQGVTSTGGVGGATTPNTGAALPLGISGGLMGLGLGLLGAARRTKRRSGR